jgi:hypothetical protein
LTGLCLKHENKDSPLFLWLSSQVLFNRKTKSISMRRAQKVEFNYRRDFVTSVKEIHGTFLATCDKI